MPDPNVPGGKKQSTSRRVAVKAAILFLSLFLAGTAAVLAEWLCYAAGQQEYSRIAAIALETKPAAESLLSSGTDTDLPQKAPGFLPGPPSFPHNLPSFPQAPSSAASNRSRAGQDSQRQITSVDFSVLQTGNPDCVAWIEIPGTRISYPVMYRAGDGMFYLTHTYEENEGKAGAIHIDGASDGLDSRNLLLYGHTLLDGSMFTDLHRYKNPRFYQEHPFIYLHLPDGCVRQYRIAACVLTEGEQACFYLWDFKDDASAQAYYDQFMEQALYQTGVLATAADGRQTLVLSTCTKRTYRRLIFAVEQ